MMDEFARFLEATPAITTEAKEAARTRLLQAIREPAPMPPIPAPTGRHGVAFVYTGARERFEIILSAQDYRFLGTYGESVAERTFDLPGGATRTVKAGTPLVWSARMTARIVDKPGDQP
ncbi:hypothetical protein [Nonomuraea jabiensis]|uniref:hypothetical protein n=1 Tax=Nonomuraea jabiensis TaxID=882448 RepID=UPI0036A28B93